MRPELYDVYLAMMMVSVVIFVLVDTTKYFYNNQMMCKFLSRMKFLIILIEYWNADKWRSTTKEQMGVLEFESKVCETPQCGSDC
jgi:hypothetical protein